MEPGDRATQAEVADAGIPTERILETATSEVLDVATVGDLSVVRRVEIPIPPERPSGQTHASSTPHRVYAYIPRRARPPWARPDVLVLGDDLPNYLRAERSFYPLTPAGLRDLLEIPKGREGKRAAPPIVAVPVQHPGEPTLNGLAERLEEWGIPVLPLRAVVERRCRMTLLDEPGAVPTPETRRRRFVNRTLDLFCSAIGLALLIAVLPFVAPAIWLEDRGPIFYLQERMGRGRTFRLLKFRSMRVDAEGSGPAWATLGDERITRVGGFLRRYKIDELPQFLNVFKGDMAMVGPRPERDVFAETLRRFVPHYDVRQSVRPGITGWGTLRVGYGNSVEAKYLTHQYDLFHLAHRSLGFDVEILLRSLFGILVRPDRQDRFMR